MAATRSLGRQFGWLWVAFAVSTFGTWLAFDAFALIAIIVLHSGPTAVSALAAAGRVVGAAVAVPLGPWVEFRRKRPVMVAMDLVRFAAVISVPAAFAFGWLSFAQLLIVSVIVAAADIAFRAASGPYLKTLVRPEDLLVANSRFESTTWTATALGPPLGGAAISIFGPVTTAVLDAVSYLCSALGIGAIRGQEPPPAVADTPRLRVGDLFEGWRYILSHRTLRLLFFNTALVNGLIMATSPLIAVLMLGQLGFKPWQYGLAFGLPCIGGLIGSRLARTHVHRRRAARVLVGRVGLHSPGHFRDRAHHRRSVWPGHLRRRVQSRIRYLSARPDRDQPNRPHTVGVVGHQQHHHCRPDCSVGSARRPPWPARGNRDCWYPLTGDPAPAPSTLPPLARGDAIGFDPLMTAPLLASACRRRC
jgi:MFS family permease